MARSKRKADILYYKPLCVCKKGTKLVGYRTQISEKWYDVHTKTKPIAHSTVATLGWLSILKNESNSWEEMLSKANGTSKEYMPDYEAEKVIQAYIDCKAPFDSISFE